MYVGTVLVYLRFDCKNNIFCCCSCFQISSYYLISWYISIASAIIIWLRKNKAEQEFYCGQTIDRWILYSDKPCCCCINICNTVHVVVLLLATINLLTTIQLIRKIFFVSKYFSMHVVVGARIARHKFRRLINRWNVEIVLTICAVWLLLCLLLYWY